ncbi:hypothetical protein [Streptomyces sp. NPDC055109]
MQSPSDERMRNLLVALANSAVEVAADAVAVADPLHGPSYAINYGAGMADRSARLEALSCAVLRQAGMSWDAMAGRREVSRQSLHRRLSSRSDKEAEHAQKYAWLYEEQIPEELELLLRAVLRLSKSLESSLNGAPSIWKERRRTPGWWWNPDPEN